MKRRALTATVVLGATVAACQNPGPAPDSGAGPAGVVEPVRSTDVVADDPDDPAIWIHPDDPARSLIIGTNKVARPGGALVVFGLDGRIRQTIGNLDRPNNVDVEYGFDLDDRVVDIVVTTERLQRQLRVFAIDPATGRLSALGAVPVLEGAEGEGAEPMGIGLYRRPSDGQIFAIVAPKIGPGADYLWQYALTAGLDGEVEGTLVRRFGAFSELGAEPGDAGEIEAVVVDDELGYVYYADEQFGIHKWHADPGHPDAAMELAAFGLEGYQLDREGLAIWSGPDGTGYLVSTDQIPTGTTFRLYRREGAPGAPHDHSEIVGIVRTTADETDGIEVHSGGLPDFPGGLLVAMNSGPRNFLMFSWDSVWAGRHQP